MNLRHLTACFAGAALLGMGALLSAQPPAPVPSGREPVRLEAIPEAGGSIGALAKEQLEVVDNALRVARSFHEAGRLPIEAYRSWHLRKVEATHRSGATREDRIAALKAYLGFERAMEARTAADLKLGIGTDLDVADAKFHRLGAEIWLKEEAKGR
jgi:hypothetical protein